MLCRDEIADADFVSVELLYDSTTGHAYCFYLIMASILPDEDRAWVPVKLGDDIMTGGGQTPAQILPGDGSSCVLAFNKAMHRYLLILDYFLSRDAIQHCWGGVILQLTSSYVRAYKKCDAPILLFS